MHAWKEVIYMKGNIVFKGDIGITIDPNKENFNYLVNTASTLIRRTLIIS